MHAQVCGHKEICPFMFVLLVVKLTPPICRSFTPFFCTIRCQRRRSLLKRTSIFHADEPRWKRYRLFGGPADKKARGRRQRWSANCAAERWREPTVGQNFAPFLNAAGRDGWWPARFQFDRSAARAGLASFVRCYWHRPRTHKFARMTLLHANFQLVKTRPDAFDCQSSKLPDRARTRNAYKCNKNKNASSLDKIQRCLFGIWHQRRGTDSSEWRQIRKKAQLAEKHLGWRNLQEGELKKKFRLSLLD